MGIINRIRGGSGGGKKGQIKLKRGMSLNDTLLIQEDRAIQLTKFMELIMKKNNHLSPCIEEVLNSELSGNEKVFLIFQIGYKSGLTMREAAEEFQEVIGRGRESLRGQNN